MATQIKFEPRLDTAHAETLLGTFDNLQGQNITLDASDVELLGAQCLELLLSVTAIWKAAGNSITVLHSSDKFLSHLNRFGLTIDALSTEQSA